MSVRLLSVAGGNNYVSYVEVDHVRNFEEAKQQIEIAEKEEKPYKQLDLPAFDEERLWEFVDWMARRGTKYPFSIHTDRGFFQFIRIRDRARAMGFSFCD